MVRPQLPYETKLPKSTEIKSKMITSLCYDLFSDKQLTTPPTLNNIQTDFKNFYYTIMHSNNFTLDDFYKIKFIIIKNEIFSTPYKVGIKSGEIPITKNIQIGGGKRSKRQQKNFRNNSKKNKQYGGKDLELISEIPNSKGFEPISKKTWMVTIQIIGNIDVIKNQNLLLDNKTLLIEQNKYHILPSHISNLQQLYTNWEQTDTVNNYSGKDTPLHRNTRFDRSVDYLKKITERLRDCTELSTAYKVKHKEVEDMLITIRKLFSLIIFLRDQIEKNQVNYDTLERLILEITVAMNKDYHIPLPELIKLKEVQKKIASDGKDLEERFRLVSNQILDRLNRAGSLKDTAPDDIGNTFPLDVHGMNDEYGQPIPSNIATSFQKYVIPQDTNLSSDQPHADTTKYYKSEHSFHDGMNRGTGEPYGEFIDPDRVGPDVKTDNTTSFGEYEPGDKAIPYSQRPLGNDSNIVNQGMKEEYKQDEKLYHHLKDYTIEKYQSSNRPDMPELNGETQYNRDMHRRKVAAKYADFDSRGIGFDKWKSDANDRGYQTDNYDNDTVQTSLGANPGMIPLEPIKNNDSLEQNTSLIPENPPLIQTNSDLYSTQTPVITQKGGNRLSCKNKNYNFHLANLKNINIKNRKNIRYKKSLCKKKFYN